MVHHDGFLLPLNRDDEAFLGCPQLTYRSDMGLDAM